MSQGIGPAQMFIKKATKSISFNLCYGALPYTDIVSFYVLATLVDNKTKSKVFSLERFYKFLV